MSPESDTYWLTTEDDFETDPREELQKLPEDGPGFQFVGIPRGFDRDEDIPEGEYLVFNGEFFLSIRGLNLNNLTAGFEAYPSYESFVRSLKPKRKTRLPTPISKPTLPIPPRTTLLINTKTTAGELYWRLSAYANDRRITTNSQMVTGTYVTTNSDIEVVGSGFAATGRYALPTPFPAVMLSQSHLVPAHR